jgi:hypothetical protein
MNGPIRRSERQRRRSVTGVRRLPILRTAVPTGNGARMD